MVKLVIAKRKMLCYYGGGEGCRKYVLIILPFVD